MLMLIACTAPAQGPPALSPAVSPSPSGASSSPVPRSDIQFLFRERYQAGHRVPVRIENVGDVAYKYQTEYAACYLTYRDEDDREFLIPPGTHCDLISVAAIQPGETKLLFTWSLDECTRDEWGCARSRPLDPGTYRISGTFQPTGDGDAPARAEAVLKISPAR